MTKVLVATIVAGAVFVWLTGGSLPDMVASHFDASGRANGFMSRSAYVGVMLAVVVLVPVLVASAAAVVSALPSSRISVPHRDYWLAPERRQATLRSLSVRIQALAAALVVFLCLIHWLVVQANASADKRLPQTAFLATLGLLLAGIVLWLVLLYRRFHRDAR